MEYRDFEYEIQNGKVKITKYKGNTEFVEIPPKIDGMEVTEICYGAFKNCTLLKELVIPDSVEKIDAWILLNGCVR